MTTRSVGLIGDFQERHQGADRLLPQIDRFADRYPILRRARFFVDGVNRDIDVKEVTWINADGSEMAAEVWDDDRTQCFGMLMDGRAEATGIRKRGGNATLLMVFNGHHDLVKFTLPPCFEGRGWTRLLDTNDPDLPAADFEIGAVYDVTCRSLLLFERAPEQSL